MYRKLQGNPELDFLEQNPEFAYLDSVQHLVNAYGPDQASTLIWALYLLDHPDSTLYRIPKEQRLTEIETHYLKDTLDLEELKDVRRDLINTTLTKTKQAYKALSDKMEDMALFLQGLKIDGNNAKSSLDLMEKYTKTWKAFREIEQTVLAEDAKGSLRGGGQKSAREKRQA